MPTYEYQCDACEHNFDEFQSFSDKPLKKCPKCGKPKLRRVFGAGAGIIFKGSGFYQTDYRSESYKSAAQADSESSKPAADKPAGDKAATNGTSDSNGTTASANGTAGAKGAKPAGKKNKSAS